jgi:2-polyprenyl-3-methyl-5-hydroxy-6-metoxy-1,4-benzoquinol methylase
MDEIEKRKKAREFAKQSLSENKPLDWFEKLYTQAKERMAIIPWADFEPNPNLVEWFEQSNFESKNKIALKIGCGLGDDAEFLSQKDFSVTAFDISQSAIEWAKERFKNTKVNYIVADLFKVEESLKNSRFDFVVESYTLQVLPKKLRKKPFQLLQIL